MPLRCGSLNKSQSVEPYLKQCKSLGLKEKRLSGKDQTVTGIVMFGGLL